MDRAVPAPDPGRVEEFRRRHRTGVVTLVFTDMVGSTALKQQLGDRAAADFFRKHHQLIRATLRQFSQAEEIETAGDSFMLVFATPSDAVEFALSIRKQLTGLTPPSGPAAFDRIGIHLGEVVVGREEKSPKPMDLFGIQIDTCSRVMSLAQAGQVLMTRAVFDNARQVLKGEDIPGVGPLEWLNHGPYLLKGLEESVEICEVRELELGLPAQGPPPNSEKAQRKVSADEEPVMGWRPAVEQNVPGTKWTLKKKLGEGGFGEVWLGWHETLKEKRVFKFCFRADRVRALKREVTLFRVMKEKMGQHPNIVGIQEVFFDQPPFYIVMDYAEGQDLRAWCEALGGVEKVPVATRLEIVAQVADALQAAHDAGVIHRDIKPSNILIAECGLRSAESQNAVEQASASRPGSNRKSQIVNCKLEAKLTDFGIGQVVSQEALAGMTRMGFTQTMVGPGSSSHTGTQMYMAPELIAGQPASVGSDIYSLGVVLYQLLIGDFARPLTTDWARRINDPLVREDLEKCFAGDPQERFNTAARLAHSLRSVKQRRAGRRRKIAATVAITAAFLAGLLWLSFSTLRGQGSRLGGSKNHEANYRFERGKNALLNNRDERQLKDAVNWFQRAIDADTNFALAYVFLARACWPLQNLYEPTNNWGKRGIEAADRAIELCPNLPDAYVIRGAFAYTPLGKWDAKRDVTNQLYALKLNPRVKNAHFNLSFVYQHLGFLEEAAEEARKELELDPDDQGPLWLHGQTVTFQGHYQDGLRMLTSMPEEAFPHRRIAVWEKAVTLLYCGSNSQASAELNRSLTSGEVDDDGLLASFQAILCAAAKDRGCAEQKIEIAKTGDDRFIDFHHIAYDIGSAYALLGRPEEAVSWFERAAKEGFPCYGLLRSDPNLDHIATNERFKQFRDQQRKEYERNRAELFLH